MLQGKEQLGEMLKTAIRAHAQAFEDHGVEPGRHIRIPPAWPLSGMKYGSLKSLNATERQTTGQDFEKRHPMANISVRSVTTAPSNRSGAR